MGPELKYFSVRFLALLILAPIAGFGMVKIADNIVDAWKTNNRKKKWVAMTTLFGIAAGLSGWFGSL